MPEEIALAFRKRPPVALGLYSKIMEAEQMIEPPALSERPQKEEIERLYYYFAIHEYFELRKKILMGESVNIDKEFPALHNLIKVLSTILPEVITDEE